MTQSSAVVFALRCALPFGLAVLLIPATVPAHAQEPAPAPPETATQAPEATPTTPPPAAQDRPADNRAEFDAATMPLLQYSDPIGRYGFTAPAQWGQLPGPSQDEVVFQSESGDSIRVSISPLQVDAKAFQSAYVDTYLKVLQQSFDHVRYVGARSVEISGRKATDYVFSANFGYSPAVLHQVVLLGNKEVLYITFAGFGLSRIVSEQLFQTALLSFWVSPGFGGAATAGLADPDAPAFVIAVPEGWVDQGGVDGNSHMFRPRGSRPTSAYISTRVTKLDPNSPYASINDAFVTAYADGLKAQHPQGTFEMKAITRIFLGKEAAVRYDYGYISNYGIRRAITVLTVRKGYLVGVTCDAVDQAFSLFNGVFENLVSSLRFK